MATPFSRVVLILSVYIILGMQIKSFTTQYASNTILLDANVVKKPYLHGADELTKLARLEHQIYVEIQAYIKKTREKLKVLEQ